MFNERFSHEKKFKYESNNCSFTTLDEVVKENGNNVITVRAVFIDRKSKFGNRPAIITDNLIIYLPKHCISDIEKILVDDELINAINQGKCGFKPKQYVKDNVSHNTGNFIDL